MYHWRTHMNAHSLASRGILSWGGGRSAAHAAGRRWLHGFDSAQTVPARRTAGSHARRAPLSVARRLPAFPAERHRQAPAKSPGSMPGELDQAHLGDPPTANTPAIGIRRLSLRRWPLRPLPPLGSVFLRRVRPRAPRLTLSQGRDCMITTVDRNVLHREGSSKTLFRVPAHGNVHALLP